MASRTQTSAIAIVLFCAMMSQSMANPAHDSGRNFTKLDKQLVGVALNLEYFEAEYFLFGAYGCGLDCYAPYLVAGGPPPIGAQQAKLDPLSNDIVAQMGLQEVGHVRAIKQKIEEEAFPRVQLDISKETWAKVFDSALETTLDPPFDVFKNDVNYFLSCYAIPYVGLTGYTGAAPLLTGPGAKSLVARLLGVEAGQDAIIRTWLYERKDNVVEPYKFTIAEATNAISKLRDNLDHGDLTDEGLTVPIELGAEGKTTGNILSADVDSLAYTRTPEQVLSVVYSTGDASKPGGFYPKGGNGTIAKAYLGEKYP